MAGRFIKLYDKILQWEWFRHPHTLCLFIYLLLKANYKDIDHHGMVIKRGQLITSIPKISTDTGLSIQQTKTALKHLQLTGELTDVANRQYRIITILKYDDYQSVTDKISNDQPTTNRQNRQRLTDDLTPSIESIELQKDRNIDSPSENTPPTQDIWFSQFWDMYPKKTSKAQAEKEWKKLKVGPSLMASIMDGLRKWIASDQWTRDNGQFIPYPSTWLHNRRWEDEIGGLGIHSPAQRSPSPAPAPARKVIAQDYEQRDYSAVQDSFMAEQEQRVHEHMRRKELGL